MSYNLQNLFDADHDTGKKDYEFLPKASALKKHCTRDDGKVDTACERLDWTASKVQLKLDQIEKAIAAQGDLPDILAVVEVENAAVVGLLAQKLGYDGFEMTDSPDVRGIDCAVLYRKDKLTLVKFFEREVQNAYSLTRNLSALVFQLNANLGGGKFAIFPNHWPSQGNPTEARTIVAHELRAFVDEIRNKYVTSDFHYVLTGDFNTTDKDSPHPLEDVILDRKWDADFADVRRLAGAAGNPMLAEMPPGTYYYGTDKVWNEFDYFLVDGGLNDRRGLEVDPLSFRIHAPSFLTKVDRVGGNIPLRYNHHSTNPTYLGYSDHFAIVVKLRYR